MKAKEYRTRLIELLGTEGPAARTAYEELVAQLHEESLTFTQQKLSQINVARSSADERIFRAYQAGYEKWRSVYHGVSTALGHPPPAPLHRSGLFLMVLKNNALRYLEGKFTLQEFINANEFLDGMVARCEARPCHEFNKVRGQLRAKFGYV